MRKNLLKYFHGGIFYSAGQLFTRPGHTIREYIEGKRVKHFEPIALLLTLATLYGLLYHTFGINLFVDVSNSTASVNNTNLNIINDWMSNNYSLETCLFVPIYALGSFIVFRKQKYNFIEHVYLNTFLGSQRIFLHLLIFPLFVVFNGTAQLKVVMDVSIFLDIILLIWSYTQFFNRLTKTKAILLSVLSYLIFLVFFLIISSAVLLIFNLV
ncbi:MAG: DUF3667 domain-containing protein [Ignavibacteriales bacterium]|nr:DUF3667 domain-containing protein [Ignavibacteriales bacterium]